MTARLIIAFGAPIYLPGTEHLVFSPELYEYARALQNGLDHANNITPSMRFNSADVFFKSYF